MSKNIIEIALKAGFINTIHGLESPFIEGEDLTDNLKLFASLLLAQPEQELSVKLPESEDEAVMMNLLSDNWLRHHAPHRLNQPEQGVEPTLHKSTPLYTSPPKREPIEDGELEVWYSQHTWAMDKQEYTWGFRDAEKAHGITGGE